MFKNLLDNILSRNKDIFPRGLGVNELPYEIYQGKQPIKSSEFKNIVNEIFLPKIKEHGFKGKDFFFFKENIEYTEIVYFWTFEVGGAVAVDLLVTFNKINYPDESNVHNLKKIRPINAEFDKRLSPNGEKNKQGQNVWFWVFKDSIDQNREIVEDIWRVFSFRGIEYFKQFENHSDYIKKITKSNYKQFPDFDLTLYLGRREKGILFFLFTYWLQIGDKIKAKEFAKMGLEITNHDTDKRYFMEFKKYLDIENSNNK